MFIHSYHNGHQRDTTGVDEMGYSFNSLTLNEADITEMKRAYLADNSAHLGVPISTIYRIIALGDTEGSDAGLIKKVMSWKDSVFFAHTAPDTSAPILYTPASMQVLMWPNINDDRPDLTKMLVTVVPSMAMVRLTTMDTIVAQEEMEEGHYMTHDLKFDAMLLSHNCAQHCSLAQTLRNVAAIGWWPEVKTDIARFYNSCSLCLPKRRAHRATGISVMAAQRFKALQMDFKILDGDIASACGYPAILTIICMATRMAMYIPVKTIDTVKTARMFMNRWYPQFGLPTVFRSDRGAAFASHLMSAVRAVLGVRQWDSSCADDAQHHSLIENKHKVLDATLDMAFNKGDIQNEDDLEFYSSQAMARNNLDMLTDTATAFERVTGEVPRTLMDMASSERQPAEVRQFKPADALFINRLKDFVHENMSWLRLVNSERVRKDVSHKLAGAKNKLTTQFDLRVGDMVSYRGAAVKILALMHPSKHGYSKAEVRTVTHDSDTTDTVNFADLTPLGDVRPELMVPRDIDMSPGRLVFFEVNSRIHSGNIIDVDGVELQVHDTLQANKKLHRFVPLYRNSKGDPVPREKPHKSFPPCTTCVNQSQVLATAPLEKFLVPKSALSSLRSRGVVMSPITVTHSAPAVHTESEQTGYTTTAASITHPDMISALDAIRLEHDTHATTNVQRCHQRREAVVFPVTMISSLSGREQIRYMRLLRGIARALGAAPFGSTAQLLAAVHVASRRHSIDTPGSYPGHDTDMADRWLPTLSDLTDMALQINMRMGAHHVSRSLSPVRSVTPQGWPSRRNRPPADIADAPTQGFKTDYQSTDHPRCVRSDCPCSSTWNGEAGEHCCRTCRHHGRCADNYHPHPIQPSQGNAAQPACTRPGCPCPSTWNGRAGEHCCRACQRGKPCAEPYHPLPMQHGQPHGRPYQVGQHRTKRPSTQLTYPHCVTPGCPCTSTFNGEPGHPCCRTCRDGTPCVANFHTRPFPEADRHSTLPQGQAAAAAAGTLMQQTVIDLSHDADVDDDDGDMYDMLAMYPPPYASHDIVEHRSEPSALVTDDRTSVGRIIVATIIIYVTWITMQVIQRTLEKYLA